MNLTVNGVTLNSVPGATNYVLTAPAAPMADLSVTKADSPDPILLGSGDITYTARIALDEHAPELRWGMTAEITFDK